MGDVPDHQDSGSPWAGPAEAVVSGPVATAEPERWLLDQPRRRTFVPSRREATAVDTYCAELCPPSEAAAASSEVLDTFTGEGPADLLAHTRVVAAGHTGAGRGRSRVWRRRDKACDSTPGLLAARANKTLGETEAATLDAHVSSCLPCQALELRAQRAERAFAAILAAGFVQDATAAVAETPRPAVASGDTARWIPDAAAAAATAEFQSPRELPTDPRTRRRRLAGAVLACGAVVAATIAAIVLITGSNTRHRAVSSQLASVHQTTTAHTAVHRHAAKPHARPRKRVVVVHHAHHAKAHQTATPPAASPVTSSAPPPVTPTPVVSTPPPAPPSQPTPAAAPPPTASIQQPSLGAVNAPTQKVGSK